MTIFRLLLQSRDKTCVSKRPFLVAIIENIWTLEGVTIVWQKWHNTDLPLHCSPFTRYYGHTSQDDEMGGPCSSYGSNEKCMEFSFHVTYPAVLLTL